MLPVKNAQIVVALVLVASLFGLACRTFDLITTGSVSPARSANRPSSSPAPTRPPGTADPLAAYDYVPDGTPRCTQGDNSASVVSGRVLVDGDPVAEQLVQASSGPGGEPISEFPAATDESGRYQVTFVCDGEACNGSFWLWLVDADFEQVSPFVQFIFDNQCRRGTLDFRNR
jgi:hypothetical protein